MYFSFRSENASFIGALEAVLACARRGGIEVLSLHAGRCDMCHTYASLRVQAQDEGMLQLLMARLGGMIDIFSLSVLESPIRPDATEIRSSEEQTEAQDLM